MTDNLSRSCNALPSALSTTIVVALVFQCRSGPGIRTSSALPFIPVMATSSTPPAATTPIRDTCKFAALMEIDGSCKSPEAALGAWPTKFAAQILAKPFWRSTRTVTLLSAFGSSVVTNVIPCPIVTCAPTIFRFHASISNSPLIPLAVAITSTEGLIHKSEPRKSIAPPATGLLPESTFDSVALKLPRFS